MSEPVNVIYVLSDSVGETADLVVRAALSQFDREGIVVRRVPYVEDQSTVDEMLMSARENDALVAFTIVMPELRNYLLEQAKMLNVAAVDIMGPMIHAMEKKLKQKPKLKPGMVRQLDEDYFRRVEAVEFAVKYDDGRDARGILRAEIVLIGVSRTSKTPLSMYLAHKRIKVANVPLVPEVDPPEELFQIPKERCIGLTIHPEQLLRIRGERLRSLGLAEGANYASEQRILEELAYAEKIMKRIGCRIIDVSDKAVEETANIILDMYRK